MAISKLKNRKLIELTKPTALTVWSEMSDAIAVEIIITADASADSSITGQNSLNMDFRSKIKR